MSASITPSGGGSISLSATGSYESAGKFLSGEPGSEKIGGMQYGWDYPSSAGVDGTGTRNYGFRGQMIDLQAVYVANSANDCLSAVQSDLAALAAGPADITYYGQTYHACMLDAQASGMLEPVKSTGLPSAKFFTIVHLSFERKRLA